MMDSLQEKPAIPRKRMWKKHHVEQELRGGSATIHAEMSMNTIDAMYQMLEECRLHAMSSGSVYLLDKLELFLDDYKANPQPKEPPHADAE